MPDWHGWQETVEEEGEEEEEEEEEPLCWAEHADMPFRELQRLFPGRSLHVDGCMIGSRA